MNLVFAFVLVAVLPNSLTQEEMARFERPTRPVYAAPADVRHQQMIANQRTFSVLIQPIIVRPVVPRYYRAQAPGTSSYWRMHYRRAYQIQRIQLERQRLYNDRYRPIYYPYYYRRW